VQGLGLLVELLQLGGQQARLRLQRTGGGGGPGSRPLRSNSCRSSSASSWAMAMLTAEGTRPSWRAAAENEPLSSTARNSGTCSAERPCRAIYQ
jgi:hypothetical protein